MRRITFHEITKGAIEAALDAPRDVDMQLVRAQESRRILDRLFGYSLSPVLWKKVRGKLSAGRVQSVAVRLVVEREEERQAFKVAKYCDVEAQLQQLDPRLVFSARLTELDGVKLAGGKDFDPDTGELKEPGKRVHLGDDLAMEVALAARRAVPWTVAAVDRKETTQRPSPPFTTSTLQQAASGSPAHGSPADHARGPAPVRGRRPGGRAPRGPDHLHEDRLADPQREGPGRDRAADP